MAINPGKLAALVEHHGRNPMQPHIPMDDEMDSPPDQDSEMGEKSGEDLISSMGEFGQTLVESADVIISIADDIGDDLIAEEPAPETEAAIDAAVDGMPEVIASGLGQLGDMSPDELVKVADVLVREVESATSVGESSPQESERVAAFLSRAAGVNAAPPPDEDPASIEEAGPTPPAPRKPPRLPPPV